MYSSYMLIVYYRMQLQNPISVDVLKTYIGKDEVTCQKVLMFSDNSIVKKKV